ncbi:aminotransferase class V-fold PLP-dependent enzyme [Neolewinella agarilytica]|uniref:Selenocysteine lyase/Cysteine desulfurase n=1 Tax=Neolewinella agarilytica TaxID=478744 RepID=A0A1H9P0I1_9BACT|nr:aminotransferase class V-fold PLP-dependent enzyme [Neolewinella agarilytica]SER41774.1 Selenocysteine lyase/Cysteine desulfurase [Neolewinella agarilytica]
MSSPLVLQRDLFPFKAVAGYLNGASRAPQLKAVAAAAQHALHWRTENAGMPIPEFFGPVQEARESFARLIGAKEAERVALIPATSYGVSTVAKNLPVGKGDNIIVVEDQFPSNYYAWSVLCADAGAELRTVKRPAPGSTGSWSEHLLDAIDENTAAVAVANVHWADGSLFDLKALRARTNDVDAWLVLDATQSIGAMPFDVEDVQPDALIAGGYKWLMGPYGCGYAWYGPRMDNGQPIEENWINRAGSEDFRNLVNYQDEYRPLASRYCVGQQSNFLMLPMQIAGLAQVNAWGGDRIQAYCANLWSVITDQLQELGVGVPADRAHHLVGLSLPAGMNRDRLVAEFNRRGLHVSYRGDAVRVSPNVYNTEEEMMQLLMAIAKARG